MKTTVKHTALLFITAWISACKVPLAISKQENKSVPASYQTTQDTVNSAVIQWHTFFNDPYLVALIDTALKNNQELNIVLQEIEISRNEIMARKGEYLPFVNIRGGALADRAGKYTWNGLSEEDLKQNPDKAPKYVGDFMAGTYFSWELDVWKKLHNAKKAAAIRYLSTVEARHFLVTNLIAEIAGSYYELMALDNLLDIVNKNIDIQTNALEVIKLEKDAAKVTQLAVNRFEAQLLNTQNLQYGIRQRIIETENRINFLAGRFPQAINRDAALFNNMSFDDVRAGIPSQLLANRPDIKQAEFELAATKLDVLSSRAGFYPSFQLRAGIGLQAFNPAHLINPGSIFYTIGGDFLAPLINLKAIKATYLNANLKQVQAVYRYERSILNAHIEVVNLLTGIENFTKSYETKLKQVEMLNNSISISNNLFRSARADYLEVLTTQQEALESTIDLTEIKLQQILAKVNMYKALGGGWN